LSCRILKESLKFGTSTDAYVKRNETQSQGRVPVKLVTLTR